LRFSWLLAFVSWLFFGLQFTVVEAYLLNFISFFLKFIFAVKLFSADALVLEVLFFDGVL
jgi:hypothetical protein